MYMWRERRKEEKAHRSSARLSGIPERPTRTSHTQFDESQLESDRVASKRVRNVRSRAHSTWHKVRTHNTLDTWRMYLGYTALLSFTHGSTT
eukprot:3443203-Pleurochrysis_carterae.AAC.1